MKEFKKAMYLIEEEIILVGETEPERIMFACVFEDGTVIDYGGSPISWIKVDWDKTNELWENKGLCVLGSCDFDEEVCIEWKGSNWRLIDKDEYEENEGERWRDFDEE